MKLNSKIFRLQECGMVMGFAALYAIIAASPLHAQTVLFSNNFDSLTLGQTFTSTAVSGITGNHNGSTYIVQVSDSVSNSGSHSLYQSDQNTTGTPNATVSLGKTYTNVEVSFAVLIGSTLKIDFTNSSGTSNFSIVHEYYSNGTISANSWELRNSSNTVVDYVTDSSIGYSTDEWANISMTFNEATNSFLMTVNGVTAFSVSSGTLDSVDWSINNLSLSTGWWSGTGGSLYNYFDDISIVAIPEPSTHHLLIMAVLMLGGCYFLKSKKTLRAF